MKTTIYISIILAVLVLAAACNREPQATFNYSPYSDITTADSIKFENTSIDAHAVRWDFGDGTYSIEQNPVHHYDTMGTYQVTLTAYGKGDFKISEYSVVIDVEQTVQEELAGYWNWYARKIDYDQQNLQEQYDTLIGSLNFTSDTTIHIVDPYGDSTYTATWAVTEQGGQYVDPEFWIGSGEWKLFRKTTDKIKIIRHVPEKNNVPSHELTWYLRR